VPRKRIGREGDGVKARSCVLAFLPLWRAEQLDYATLGEVQHGAAAQSAYREIIHPATAPERRAALIQNLKAYCALDTLALVRVARRFEGRP
jgi:hypothetical protein